MSGSYIPLVSICCITYNHEFYIRNAIDGFLTQKTTFPIEIIIHDDASTDRTAQIINEYALKYPNLFVTIFQKENQYSKGIKIWPTIVFPKARGKYIALCEGDDYWTDPYKLQKQIDFLEDAKNFSFCFHNIERINSDGETLNSSGEREHQEYSAYNLFNINIPTLSIVMRNIVHQLPAEILRVPHIDSFLIAILASIGKGADLGFVGGCYRIHEAGIYSGKTLTNRFLNTMKTRRVMMESNYFSNDFKKLIYNQMINKKKNI